MTACPKCGRRNWYGHPARCAPEPLGGNAVDQRAWFERTGHCGGCGQPGSFCQCTPRNPCGCRELHPMGSGIDVDPAEVYAVAVTVEQEGLF